MKFRPTKPAEPFAGRTQQPEKSCRPKSKDLFSARVIDALIAVLAESESPPEAAAARALQAIRLRGAVDGRIWFCRQSLDLLSLREAEFVASCAARLGSGRELTEKQTAWLDQIYLRLKKVAA